MANITRAQRARNRRIRQKWLQVIFRVDTLNVQMQFVGEAFDKATRAFSGFSDGLMANAERSKSA